LVAASVYSRVLQKAAELIGGRAKLCQHLRIPAADLQKWIEDKSVPPRHIFLRAVDLILDETPLPPDSDSSEPSAPFDCGAPGDGPSTYLLD
jgi:hypothetical protein